MSLSVSAKRPRKNKKLELRGSVTHWKYCSSYWQNHLRVFSVPHCVCNTCLSNKSGFVTFHAFYNIVCFLFLGASVIRRASRYLQKSPCGLSVCGAAYVSIRENDAMVISEGHSIIDAN